MAAFGSCSYLQKVGILHHYTYCVIINWRILILWPSSLQIYQHNAIVFAVFGFVLQPNAFACILFICFAGTKHCSVLSSLLLAGFDLFVQSTCLLGVQHDVD